MIDESIKPTTLPANLRSEAAKHRSAVQKQDRSALGLHFKQALEKQLLEDVKDKYVGEDGDEFVVIHRRIDRLVRNWLARAEKSEVAMQNVLDRMIGKPTQPVEAKVTLTHEDWLDELAGGN